MAEQSDYISSHMPLSPQTEGLVSRDIFGHMKDGVCIINVTRGAVFDEKAFIEYLDIDKTTYREEESK